MIFRDETSNRDLRLAQVEARQALLLYESVVKEDERGRIIFISGEDGIGKSDILQVLADTLSKAQPQPLVIAGRFRDGNYFPWDIGKEKPFPTAEALVASGASLASAVQAASSSFSSTVAAVLSPEIKFAAALIAQSLQAFGAVGQFLNKGREQHQRALSRRDFKDMLREASQEQPLIYLFDDLHKSGFQWHYLFLEVAREIAAERPVLIFISLDGPIHPGSHQEHESELLWLVRELISEGLADWWPVSPLGRADVEALVGQCVPGMVDHLRGVTGGNPRLLIKLFKDWQHRDIIRLQEGQWVWGSIGAPAINLFKDVLEERLKTLMKSAGWQESNGLKTYNQAAELLACAALEGALFTAEAVARALNRDPDEVIDFIDEALTQGDDRPLGIITEVESVRLVDESKGKRPLWRYAFISSLYVAAAREFRLKQERVILAQALAQSLILSYSPEEKLVASNLAQLFNIGGNLEMAAHFQRMADYAMLRDDLRQHALYLLSINKDDWDKWMCRQAAALFLEAGHKMMNIDPHDEVLVLFEEAHKMAHRGGLIHQQAKAIYSCGLINNKLGNIGLSREQTKEALLLFQKLHNRSYQGGCLHHLGLIETQSGNYELAREYVQQALEIPEPIAGPYVKAASLLQLGEIEIFTSNYELAQEYTQRALEIAGELGHRHLQATSLHRLGVINYSRGDYGATLRYAQQALEIAKEIGSHYLQATSLHQLGSVQIVDGNYELARENTQRSLEFAIALGERDWQAISLQQLGEIELTTGNYELAREYIQRSLEIREELGDRSGYETSSILLGKLNKSENES